MSEETSKFEWIKVAKIEDIPKNEGRAFPVADRMIAIFESDGH